MQYVLMHKRLPILGLELNEATGGIIKTGKIYHEQHLPLGIVGYKREINRAVLNQWWLGRAIPASRSGIRDALDMLEVPMPQMLIEKCLGLSLSDQYWICPKDRNIKWDDVNFFNNPFSEDVGNALFGKKPDILEMNLMFPVIHPMDG